MNEINQQSIQQMNTKNTFPAKERICAILGLSFQSTYPEIEQAYNSHTLRLEAICPGNAAEADLLQEKRSTLASSFQRYRHEYEVKGEASVAESIAAAHAKKRRNTLYSFNIPCVFWCIAKAGDCFWNCCCSWATTGCGDEAKMDEVSRCCYNEGGACDCLRTADTILALVGIVGGLIWLIRHIAPGVGRAHDNHLQKKATAKKRKFIRSYDADYLPALQDAYSEWQDLQRYKTDIRHFLGIVDRFPATDDVKEQYLRMVASVDTGYGILNDRWCQLRRYLEGLQNVKDGTYYRHLCNESDDWNKYAEMFRNRKAPWEEDQ